MAKPFTQKPQRVAIDTPLGTDHFLLLHFAGREEMSRLFTYHAYMVRDPDKEQAGPVDPTKIIGKNVTIENRYEWDKAGDKAKATAYINGHVRRFVAAGTVGREFREYRAEIVPWLWFLTQKADCRIFQEMTAKDIIEKIFGDLSFSDFEWQLDRTPENRVYCVQYRETCFNFVSRLLEEEGIGYYFKHEDGKHTLCLTDKVGGYVNCDEETVDFADDYNAEQNRIYRWQRQWEFRTGKYAHTDYDFKKSDKSLTTTAETKLTVSDFKKYEIYDYPGLYDDKDLKDSVGQKFADIRIKEQETPYDVVSASSSCGSFHPGGKFTMAKHPSKAENKQFLVVAIEHEGSDETYFAGSGGSPKYTNTFNCIPKDTVFVPARITPKPVVEGLHTAVVTGPDGQEIHTDEHGRIKVQFHWDREGKKDDKTSCWIRVSQYWAGKSWGGHCHPRIGHEVIVDFLEGDPDRPIVTGRVYNGQNKFPYELPANQTKTGILTRSSMEGDKTHFNELRFEDKKDKEEVYFHAERDMNRVVERDDVLVVGWVDLKMSDKGPDDGKQTIDLRGKQTITIHEGDRYEEIKKGNEDVFVKEGNRYHEITKGTDTLKVKSDRDITITDGNHAVTVSKGDHALTVALGNHSINVDAGKTEHVAMQSILLKVGSSTIKLDQMGITIKAPMVKIEGQMTADMKGGISAKVEGGAMLTLKGGITMIN